MPLQNTSEPALTGRTSSRLPPAGAPQDAADARNLRSLRHSTRDGIAFSVMSGAGETYLSAYALFLKATAEQIAWLASIPPLIGATLQLVSAWLGGRGTPRKTLIVVGACVQGLIWLPLVLLPLVMPAHAVPLLIGCVVLYHACSNFIQPQWSSLMRDLVPEKRRGRYFGQRTRIASLTAFIALVSAGGVLAAFNRHEATLAGFMVIFLIAGIARFVSVYHLGRMHDPQLSGRVERARIFTGVWRSLKFLRGSQFLHFSLFFACMQCAVAIASPFFTLYMLRDLGYSYAQFMAASASAVIMQILTLNGWGRISDLFGNRLVLVVTGWLIPIVPALWLFSTNFWYLLAVQALGGLAWAGFSLSAGNFLYDLRPGPRLARDMAVHNVLASIGIFAGALLGGYMATHLPDSGVTTAGVSLHWEFALLAVFGVSALARLAVAGIFLPRLKEIRQVRELSISTLVFRVTRVHALSGLMFDIVAPREKPASAGAPTPALEAARAARS
ncbi:MAG: MFS transporter [Gammaproteobacteria bacterium]